MMAQVEGQVLGVSEGATKTGKKYKSVEILQTGNGRGSEVVKIRCWGDLPKLEVGKLLSVKALVSAFVGGRGGAALSVDLY